MSRKSMSWESDSDATGEKDEANEGLLYRNWVDRLTTEWWLIDGRCVKDKIGMGPAPTATTAWLADAGGGDAGTGRKLDATLDRPGGTQEEGKRGAAPAGARTPPAWAASSSAD